MAIEAERLILNIDANISRLRTELDRAVGTTEKRMRAIEKRAEQANERIRNSFRGLGTGLTASLAGALGTREIVQYADAWTTAGNKVRAAGESAGLQVRSVEDLKDAANTARADLGSYVDLYAALTRSTKGVAKSEQEVADATNIVAKAFKAGGAGASEQASGILQLGQALGSGVLQGDELRSLLENAPVLARVIADEFGVSVAQLKSLGADGALVSDRVFSGILKGGAAVEKQFAATNATIGDAITAVENEFTAYIGLADQSVGASRQLVGALQFLAVNFGTVANTTLQFATVLIGAFTGRAIGGAILGLGNAVVALGTFLTALRAGTIVAGTFTAALGPIGLLAGAAAAGILLLQSRQTEAEAAAEAHAEALRVLDAAIVAASSGAADAVANVNALANEQRAAAQAAIVYAKAQIAAARATAEANKAVLFSGSGEEALLAPAFRDGSATLEEQRTTAALATAQARLADIESRLDSAGNVSIPPVATRAPVGSTSVGGGGGSRSAASADTTRQADAVKEMIAELEREKALIGATDVARNVSNALRQAGADATEAQKARITELVTAIESETQALEDQKAAQAALKATASDVLHTIADGIKEGASAGEILGSVFEKLASQLIDIAIQNLVDQAFGGLKSGGAGGGAILGNTKSLFRRAA